MKAMKTHLKEIADTAMDDQATKLDAKDCLIEARGHDQNHDAYMERLRDHLTIKNDQAGLVLWQKAMGADAKEDAKVYGGGAEYKVIKSLHYGIKIARGLHGVVKLCLPDERRRSA